MASHSSSLTKAQTLQCYSISSTLQSPGVPMPLVKSCLKSGPRSRKQERCRECPQAGPELCQKAYNFTQREARDGRGSKGEPKQPTWASTDQAAGLFTLHPPPDLDPTVSDTVKVKPLLPQTMRDAACSEPQQS